MNVRFKLLRIKHWQTIPYSFSLMLFAIAVPFYPFFSQFFSLNRSLLFLFSAGLMTGVLLLTLSLERKSAQFPPTMLLPTILFFIMGLIAAIRGFPLGATNYFVGPIMAAIIFSAFPQGYRIYIVVSLGINLVVAAYEHLTGHYFFISMNNGGGILLNETLFSGLTGIFRAKGLFHGPLSLGAFAITTALIFRKNPVMLSASLVLATLAASRSAMVIIAIMILTLFWPMIIKLKIRQIILPVLVLLISITYVFTFVADANFIARLEQLVNWSGGANAARLYYWMAGINLYFNNFDFFNIFFGYPGASVLAFANSSENDFIQILLDTGLIGFSVTIFYILYSWLSSLSVGRVDFIAVLCVLVSMFFFPLTYQLFSNITVWFFLMSIMQTQYEKLKKSRLTASHLGRSHA